MPHPISPIAAELAERCAFVGLHLLLMDQAALADGALTAASCKGYLAMSAQHSRLLRSLNGMKATRASSGSSTSLVAQLAAAAAERAA